MTLPVTIIDYGSGNILSVTRAFEHCGAAPTLTDDPGVIDRAERLILPGVGAFSSGMEGLRERGLIEAIRRYAASGRPLLGICLGMQMLASESEEFGRHEGLGIIPGRVVPIPGVDVNGSPQRVPHIGWAAVNPPDERAWGGTLFKNIPVGTAFYLVHSFMYEPDNPENRIAECLYGGSPITAAVQAGRIVGCQFHPEKSGAAGLQLLAEFLRL